MREEYKRRSEIKYCECLRPYIQVSPFQRYCPKCTENWYEIRLTIKIIKNERNNKELQRGAC